MKTEGRYEVQFWKGGQWQSAGAVERPSDVWVLRRAVALKHDLPRAKIRTLDHRPGELTPKKPTGGQKGSLPRRRFGVTA